MEITRTIIAVCLGLVVASQAQDCSKPVPGPNMNLKDSDIVLTTFPDGSRATFVCSLGYTTAGGSGVVTCTAGSWSQVTLHCKKKVCGSPGEVDNGEIEYIPGNEFGDKLVVTCNLGFRLVGKRELTCGDQGWLGRLPVCEVVTCDLPADIPYGLFSPVKDVYNYREVVQYSCKKDFTLSRSKSVTCSEDGTFTPGPPQCTEVECADPKVANGEWVSGSRPPHKYLATVTYRCYAGYKMEGDASMECGLNGQWTPGIPKCIAVTCSPPPTITSGTFSPQKPLYQYLETVAYSCDQGFTLSGSKSLSCSLDGTFKGSPPTCNTVTCGPPPTITSGTFSPQKSLYQYQEMVAYSCDQGFTLSGSKSLSCSLDGTFNGSPPTCSRKVSPTTPTTITTPTTTITTPTTTITTPTTTITTTTITTPTTTITTPTDGGSSPTHPTVGLRLAVVFGTLVGTLIGSIIVGRLVCRKKRESKRHHIVPDLKV